MSPEEFGAASMLTAASLLLTAVLASPLVQLIIRAAARSENDGPAVLRVAGLYCYYLLPTIAALTAAAVVLWIPTILGVPGAIWGIELLAIGMQPSAVVFAMWVAQAREQIDRFIWLSSVSIVVTATSKLVLVVVMKLGVLGWALSDLSSAVITAALAMWLIRLPRVTVPARVVRQAAIFSLPLIPHSASIWALTSMSRPAMAAVSSLQQVGVLSFGLTLASVAGLILAEANRAFLPRYSRETFPAPTAETRAPVSWQLTAAFVVPALVGFGIAVGGHWIFDDAYWPSFALTGTILIGQAAYGLYLIPMNYLTQTAGLPKYSSMASGSGAVIVLAFILMFGHQYGAAGVAYATAAGYIVMATVAMTLTFTHSLLIHWRSWTPMWPNVALGITALGLSVLALASPVGSALWWLSTAACLMAAVGSIYITARNSRL
jgi:O-antigen/teichoic acid export membrane protein